MRILLVDDDVVFAKLFVTKLAELGLRDVTVAHSAEEAVALLDQGASPFDCFLLDIILGDSNGIDLCHILRMRADNKLAPIIMITSQRGSTLMSRAFSAGATDFLRKPLDHNELVGRIKTAMLLVELAKRAKAPIGASEIPLRRNSLSHDNPPLKPVWFPKIEGMVKFSCLQKKLSELRSRNETPKLYRVHIKDFGVLLGQADYTELKQHLHQVSSLLSEAVSGD
jgi:phosphoserine phosphatase RsbU/P